MKEKYTGPPTKNEVKLLSKDLLFKNFSTYYDHTKNNVIDCDSSRSFKLSIFDCVRIGVISLQFAVPASIELMKYYERNVHLLVLCEKFK